MTIRKEDNIVVKPQVSGRVEGRSDYVFYSFDKESAQFIIAFVDANDKPLDLLNANPTVLLIIEEDGKQKKFVLDGTDMKEVSIIDGKVAFIIPDFLLGYRGKVEMYIGVTFADGSSSDELHLAFTMKESPFNAAYEEAKNYYVASFEMLLHEVELAKTTAINDINKQLPEIKKKLSDVESRIEIAEQNIDEVMEKTELHEMYSNSIDFGDYDYSGNPNLMRTIQASDFVIDSGTSLSDVGYNSIRLTSQGVDRLGAGTSNNVPSLVSGKTYTISAKVKLEEGTTGNIDKIRVNYRKFNGGTILLSATTKGIEVGKEITIKGTGIVNYEITDLSRFYLSIDTEVGSKINGSVIVSDIKIEEGSTATPYQPNLLDAPYYLSKVALGENIANKGTTFPIKSSAYEIYKGNTEEELIIGQTYTITLKGTKPASQTFTAYNYWNVNLGDLKPVEGLTDVWSLTFTPTKLEPGLPKDFRVFQMPKSTIGACQIDWLKIEKGNTRTPNIEQYKYRGIGMRDSNNPKGYVWDLAPEYVEDNLATDVKISEITGKANKYTDNAIAAVNTNVVNVADDLARQINSNKTAAESYADTKKTEAVNESKKYTDEAITNIKPYRTSLRIESGFSDGFTGWVTFERIGDIVIVSYALSPSTNTGTWKTPLPIASIPEEFHFNSNAYSTGSIATSYISNDVCQVGMNEQGLQFASWNRTAGIAQFAGQVTGAVKSREK